MNFFFTKDHPDTGPAAGTPEWRIERCEARRKR